MDIRLCAAILRIAVIGVLLDVVLSVPYRAFAADQQQRFPRGHTAYFVRRHQLTARQLIVDGAGAAATPCLAPCPDADGLLAQQLRHELQRFRLVAAAQKQQRITVTDDALAFIPIAGLDALDVLHDDINADIVAAAGSQHLGIAVRLGNVGPFVLYHSYRYRQPPVIPLVRPQIKLLKALGKQHTDQIVHAAIVDGGNAEDGPLPLTQGAEVHLVLLHDVRILRKDKRRQPNGGGYKNALSSLA